MLKKIIYYLVQGAKNQPNLRTVLLHDIYRLNHLPDIRYGAFVIETEQGVHTVPDSLLRFTFTLYYVDRLTINKDNMLDAQSTGIDVLHNILVNLPEEIDLISSTYRVFDQKFKDDCAGAYVNVTLDVPVNYSCTEDLKGGDFNLDFNDDFLIYINDFE